MCYIIWSRYPCGHTKEVGHEQCAIWEGTMSFCPKPAFKSIEERKLCYECSIETDAVNLRKKDIDNLAEIVLAELKDMRSGKESADANQQDAVMTSLKRVTDLYSRKLLTAEKELRSMKEAVSEKKQPDQPPPLKMKAGSFGSVKQKVDRFNTYWRDQIRRHEAQLEKAARTHSPWLIDGVQKRLEYSHEKWDKQIEDIFKGAEDTLPELE